MEITKTNIWESLSKSEKAIYNALEFYRNLNTNLCCPTIIQISERVGLSTTQIKRLIKKLKEHGLINIIPIKNTHNNFRHNSYTFNSPAETQTVATTKTQTVAATKTIVYRFFCHSSFL